jgi:DNA-binding NarL/FixJ family response regulator
MLRLGVGRVIDDAGGRVVAEAADGGAAMSAVRTHRPDVLVIGDHAGIGTDAAGLVELADDARRVAPDLRCLALVAGMGPDDLRLVLAAGVDGLLPRSVDPGELRAALIRLDAGERVVSPQVIAAMFGSGGAAPSPDGPAGDAVVALTSKEREVLALLASGRSNAEIAGAMFLSAATIKTHLAHIYAKLGVRSRYEALSLAVALGMVG